MLKELSREFNLQLCLDCVSSLGVVKCDLGGVALASGVSGKGLRSMAGLALVFHNGNLPEPMRPLPRYLDLRMYTSNGVPFTIPSNLVAALSVSLETLDAPTRCNEVRETADWLCEKLRETGLKPLAAEADRFPGAITLVVPPNISSSELGYTLQREGWLLSYKSQYLADRNWIQVCLLGHTKRSDLEPLTAILAAKVKN